MIRVQQVIRLTMALGVLSAVGLLAGFLALADIAHGEPDLTLEWNVLRGTWLLVVAFHVSALWTLRRVHRSLSG